MRHFLALIFSVFALLSVAQAGQSVKILPAPRQAEVDGVRGATIKRMPAGGEFVLTVNKGQDVSYYRIQWYKDGVLLSGQTGQDLRYPNATPDMNGVYTVSMSNPCATVESSPISVYVESRPFQVNTQVGNDNGIAGVQSSEVSPFSLSDVAPNPVTDRATIAFTTTETAMVTIRVVDLTGSVVATLVNDQLPAGQHSVAMNTKEHNMSSSLYYVVMSAPGYTDTKPLMLAK